VLSATAEECLFRGTLQPWLGYVPTSILFGLLHFVPIRVFLPWTAFAMIAGFVFGALFGGTGNLITPIVAHALVNGVNLHLIVRGRRAPPAGEPETGAVPAART
jgi:membrane protease YdiL (CAAX protease family)